MTSSTHGWSPGPALRRPSTQSLITFGVVAGAVVFVLLQLSPSLLVANTTTAGGDTGAHVWGPAYLRDHLLPHGRLTGWAPDWYDGFPALTFYFPVPSVLIVVLGAVLPYNVAFKLVTVLGVLGLPVAAWVFGRLIRLREPGPPLLAVATIPFLFDRFHSIWGGNIAATLAGEFAFTISLCLALVYLGVLWRGLEEGRYRALAAALLAVTGLCHMIPTLFALGGTALIFLMRPRLRRLGHIATVGAVAGALVAWWALPFVVWNRYTTNMGWERTTEYMNNLFPFLNHRIDPAYRHTAHMWVVVLLAASGALAALFLRRGPAVFIVLLAGASALAFRLVPVGPLWNARLLPFWYLCLYFLAAVAVSEVAIALGRLGTRLAPVVGLGVMVVAVGYTLGVLPWGLPNASAANRSFVPYWAEWNYSGYERKPAYPEYKSMIDTMARLPCGRAMWEYEADLNRYGTPMAPMLLPYWTHGCIDSMEGLFFESAGSTPYHFLNQSELSQGPSRALRDLPYRSLDVNAGVQHLQLLGVRYYMAFSKAALAQAHANPDLHLVATSSPWEIFEVAGSDEVTALDYEPAVLTGVSTDRTHWLAQAVAWYQDPSRWAVPVADGGPKEWPRVTSADELPERVPVAHATVSNIRTGDDRISFDVDQPGTPVLVKASYFPNWQASGAHGPWRVTPNLMVVVPTSRHVSLHYGFTTVDRLGWTLSALGLIALLGLALPASVAGRVVPDEALAWRELTRTPVATVDLAPV